ncbi:MAG: hypothetical protein JW779_01370 [Candidatus Thorarchaeota archaeon]|nr:hypothetical protein [Candidatus Thorarchaeota archaeon]
MALHQVPTTQIQFIQPSINRQITAFSPPGLNIEAAKYPILIASILASTEPLEYLSIFDHPEAWGGLDREAILSMRRRLYRFSVPIDARAMEPSDIVETLQTIALSVSPVAIETEAGTLPQQRLNPLGGQLPASPEIRVKSFDIISEPEISRVAKRITECDIPASEAAWKLFDYEYTLDQVARLMSVGLLGRMDSRRFVPTRGAYKAVIDAFVNRCLMELLEQPITSSYSLATAELFGENFTILAQPGEPRVDYLRIERTENGLERGVSLEGIKNITIDSKTSVFSDHVRFVSYEYLLKREETSHLTVFHFSRSSNNSIFGPWLARAGVKMALDTGLVELDNRENALAVLKSFLAPDISVWTQEDTLFDGYSGAFRIIENSSPRTQL